MRANLCRLSDTLTLTRDSAGTYWLYDYTLGRNLSMRAATEQAAFTEALTFYQQRTIRVEREYRRLREEREYRRLREAVDNFIVEVKEDD